MSDRGERRRGRAWFDALATGHGASSETLASLLVAESTIGDQAAVFLCVVPDPSNRFPCVREGQVGLEEAYALAIHVRRTMHDDAEISREKKRAIVAIVDVKSQAYGRREETSAIFLAAATAADAYASARRAGHPVIALIVGHAFSGGFLTHGYQSSRILALDDAGVVIHAMHKEAAARITRRSVAELERLSGEIVPMSYNVHDYFRLGLLHQLLHAENPEEPTPSDIDHVRHALGQAIQSARVGLSDLSSRWESKEAHETRRPTLAVREAMKAQWNTMRPVQ